MSHNHSLPCVATHMCPPTNTETLYRHQLASTYTPRKEFLLPCSSSSPSSSAADMPISSSRPPFPLSPGSRGEANSLPSFPRRVFSDIPPRIWNGSIAVLTAMLAQFLVAGIERLLGGNSAEFPASILAMAVAFCLIWTVGLLVSGVDDFYERHLRCAVSELGFFFLNTFTQLTCYANNSLGGKSANEHPPPGRFVEQTHASWIYHPLYHGLPEPSRRWPNGWPYHRILR